MAQAVVYQYVAGYDGAGNVMSYNDSVMGNWTFGYDTLNRLTGATVTAGNHAGWPRDCARW